MPYNSYWKPALVWASTLIITGTDALPGLSNSISQTSRSAVPIDDGFHMSISIGTPPQKFQVLIDSGAGSLAMASVFLPENQTEGRTVYNPRKSSTAEKLDGYGYKNCYGSGHCGFGDVYKDKITVGNISATLAFEVSTGNNGVGNSQSSADSGDFGMAYAQGGMSTRPKAVPTWFQTIMSQLDSKVFAFSHEQNQGQIQFGYIDTSYNIGYAPLNADYFWGVNFTGYKAGNYVPREWTVVVDSGTSRSALPPDVAQGYFDQVPGSAKTGSGYTYPCNTALPDFIYGIGSFRGVIPGTFLEGKETGNGRCLSILEVKDGSVIFGQNFIKAQYVVHDYERKRVGFGNKRTS